MYHIGVPTNQIEALSDKKNVNVVPCMMPYITAFFMPRKNSDRPRVVPNKAVNFAFIGEFAETERDCIFTIEYAARTAMEAVYQLLNVNRGIPEVYASCYDIRCLLRGTKVLLNGNTIQDSDLPWVGKKLIKRICKKNLVINKILKDAKLI
jgi:oleate hydratase